jgi:hypothetical protein
MPSVEYGLDSSWLVLPAIFHGISFSFSFSFSSIFTAPCGRFSSTGVNIVKRSSALLLLLRNILHGPIPQIRRGQEHVFTDKFGGRELLLRVDPFGRLRKEEGRRKKHVADHQDDAGPHQTQRLAQVPDRFLFGLSDQDRLRPRRLPQGRSWLLSRTWSASSRRPPTSKGTRARKGPTPSGS